MKLFSRIIHVDEALTQGVDWSSLKPQFAFIGLNSRSDHLDSLLDTAKNNWPKAQLQIILSGWWNGHRRCHPLDESLDVAYWYQWWDCILPQVLTARSDRKKPKLSTRIERILDASKTQAESTESRLALVLSEGQSRREFWKTGLKNLGWLSAFPTSASLDLIGDFDVVLFDVAASFSKYAADGCQACFTELSRIRNRFPSASIVVVDSFPTLERWDAFVVAGAERIVSSPFRWVGLTCKTNSI